jgi:ribonuclease J
MVRNMGVASDLGYLRIPPGLMVDLKDVEHLPDNRVVLISTGSQGEPLSALSRMANRSHHQIRIEAQDTVVLASSLIPGNENAVYRVINGLSRWGARVVHKGVAKVHVSGHASAGELLYLLNATRPSNVMPVHGEWRHLRAHAELARLTGVRPSGSCSPRTASSSTSSTARPRSSGPSRAATSSSTASRSATSASRP